MQLTRITKENEKSFIPFFKENAPNAFSDLIRIGVTDDGEQVAGAMSAKVANGIIDITSLYVASAFRRKGFGKALVDALEDIVKDLEYDTLGAFFLESQDADSFYKTMGFNLFAYREQYYFTLGELVRSRIYQRYIKDRSIKNVIRISSLQPDEKRGLDAELAYLDYDPEWSTACFDGDKCSSLLLAVRDKESVSIIWLESKSDDVKMLLKHLGALVKKAASEFADSVDVRFRLTFNDERLPGKVEALLGGNGHLHSEGRLINAVKLL